jgi:hypothetical protein
MLHQLVVMRTVEAKRVARALPLGVYYTELMLYGSLCGSAKPVHWRHPMYQWNRKETGMHSCSNMDVAVKNSRSWCKQKELV